MICSASEKIYLSIMIFLLILLFFFEILALRDYLIQISLTIKKVNKCYSNPLTRECLNLTKSNLNITK
jgi:hypothetical protein